jgi:mono/diheme cytochrome c family protein
VGVIGRYIAALAALGLVGFGAFWLLTLPDPIAAGEISARAGDPDAGRRIFDIGGCASCHAAKGAEGDDRLKLGGGRELVTEFGTFRVPNISPDPATGIGGWRPVDLVNAMMHGVSPEGTHYYPAFPYTSYARMRPDDVVDLYAFLATLPPVSNAVDDHQLAFPFSLRRGIGLWKWLYLDPAPVVALPVEAPADVRSGRYLVEGPGHCGECHTARNVIGGPDLSRWLAGAPNPEGEGTIPNITSGEGGIGEWSIEDIVYSFETGFLPDFDTYGGQMVEVQRNLERLAPEDRSAIASYLKAVPPLPAAVAD